MQSTSPLHESDCIIKALCIYLLSDMNYCDAHLGLERLGSDSERRVALEGEKGWPVTITKKTWAQYLAVPQTPCVTLGGSLNLCASFPPAVNRASIHHPHSFEEKFTDLCEMLNPMKMHQDKNHTNIPDR